MKWDHVGIKSSDIERSLHFYCDVLGFQRRNLYIVEREERVVDLMKRSPRFDGTKIFHQDLADFKHEIKFDLIYLDFKGTMQDDLLDILRRMLILNTKPKTILYVNFLAKREQAGTHRLGNHPTAIQPIKR